MTDRTLSEQLRDRMNEPPPDKYTLQWWRQQFDEARQAQVGASIAANKAACEARDCWAELKKQRAENERLAKGLAEAEARVGQLIEQVSEMSDRQDKMADWLKKKVPAATSN